jgi:hypothetical protein
MRKENIYLTVVILVVAVGGIIFFVNGRKFLDEKSQERQEEIISCLSEKEVKLYISSDCDYCQEQKDIFGDHFEEIDVVNCNDNSDWSEKCREEKINSAPTWAFPKSLKNVKNTVLSCSDCKKENDGISCNDYCYTISEDGKFLRISGFLSLDQLNEMVACLPN